MHQKTFINWFIRQGFVFTAAVIYKKYLYFAIIQILIHITLLYEICALRCRFKRLIQTFNAEKLAPVFT